MTATRKSKENTMFDAGMAHRVDQLQTASAQVDVSDLVQLDGKTAVNTADTQTIGGQKTFSTMPIWPRATVAAAGSTVTNAAQLSAGFTSVTGANASLAVKLPATPAAGTVVIIKNVANAVLPVFPDAAATINVIGSNGALSMAAYTSAVFIADSATQWYTIPLLPS